MKILITGLIAFLAWSAGSSYWYICKIKNLCADDHVEEIVVKSDEAILEKRTSDITADTSALPAEVEITSPGKITLYCAFSSADFIPSGDLQNYLSKLSAYLKANPDRRVTITGHTDNIGSDAFNEELGLERARHLKNYLASHGLEAGNLYAATAGESEPVADNSTEAGRAKNRRIEIEITDQ
jgi:outer membrane protein OmpA-like peptidoglycan-associated protein